MDPSLPIIPPAFDVGEIKDYLDYQVKLLDVTKKLLKVRDEIGLIDENMQHRLESRIQGEKRLVQENRRLLSNIKYYIELSRGADMATQQRILRDIQSAQFEMNINNARIKLMQEMNKLEEEMLKRKIEEERKWGNLALDVGKKHLDINIKELELVKSIGEKLHKYPFGLEASAGWLAAIITLLIGAWNLLKSFETAAWNTRKALGMTKNDLKDVRSLTENIAVRYAHIGVSIESANEAVRKLQETMGSTWTITDGLVENVSILSAQLGVSEVHSAGFLRNMAAVSQSTMQTQESMLYVAADMSRAAGVSLDKVMGDVATKSDKTLTMVSRFPNAFLRTAIEARRLNTTIDEMAKAGRSILNFQESVNAEMDASVLLGRAINLQRARELAYRRDLEGSTKEILRITKQIDFENLDVFQQEAFAKATGHSVDELLKMVQAERLWEKARRDPKLAEKVKAYEALRASNEKAAKDQAKNYELELKRRANQEQLTEISNMWKQIMMEAQSALLPIVSLILKMVIPAMYIAKGLFAWTLALKSIGQLIAYVKDQITLALMINARYGKGALSIMNRFYLLLDKIAVKFKPVVDWAGRVKMAIRSAFSTGGRFARVTEFFTKLGNRVKWVGNIINKLKFGFSGGGGLGAAIGRIFPILTRIGPAFGFIFKWVPILGWVITAAQVIYNLFKRWITIFKDPNMNIGQKILHGILAIPLALYDALIKPFVDAFKWIMGLFGGKSPSVLALNILKGIMAIGTTLLKIIIFPWRMAFKLIPLLFSKLNIKEGIKAVLSGLFKLITSPFVKSFKWIMGLFGGKSPSVLALNILKGITAISTTLFDAITAPWRMAFAWIFSKIPGMGKFAAGLRGGAKGMINSVEKGATEGAAGSKVTTTETKSEQTTQAKENEKEESKQREIDNTNYLQSILEGINTLNKNLESGKIGFYVDGQLLSATIARQTEFRGGYGVNKI